MQILLVMLMAVAAIALLVVVVVFLVVPAFRFIGLCVTHVFRFIGGIIGDSLRAVGAIITMGVFVPFVILNIVIGRWSAAGHFGRSIQDECHAFGRSLYRVFLGHPARFLLLRPMLEGVEQRVPEAMAKTPGADRPSRKTGSFDGYKIVGSLPTGGSGAKLYIAEPDERRLASFARQGAPGIDRVIIKSFSLKDGSSLPQIIRESRALEAAKNIGLVLEHELTEHRFHYVMPYVPGESLGVVARRLHDESEVNGLDDRRLREAMGYVLDLLKTISAYHRAGLWHKDIKPDNIIISDGEAHLVDLGLVTPLRSAMTLTTHGTEYFRDPEMVRMALKGVKVHEVDGAKFDVYAAGAVLYSMVENSFPAHGGMSLLNKHCPEAVRWIVRRSMAEYNQRYTSSYEMYADLEATLNADDMFAVMPADLPSVKGGVDASAHDDPTPDEATRVIAAGTPAAPRATPAADHAAAAPPHAAPMNPETPGDRSRPRLSLVNWWTGAYAARPDRSAPAAKPAGGGNEADGRRPWRDDDDEPLIHKSIHRDQLPPADEQLRRARRRAKAAQQRINRKRSQVRRSRRRRDPNSRQLNAGVAIALFVFLSASVFLAGGLLLAGASDSDQRTNSDPPDRPRVDNQNGISINLEGAELDPLKFMDDLKSLGSDLEGLLEIRTQIVDAFAQAGIYDSDRGVLTFKDDGNTISIKAPGWLTADGSNAVFDNNESESVFAGSDAVFDRPGRGQLLVLNTLGESADPATVALIDDGLARLRDAGFTLVGLNDSEQDVAFAGEALHAIGLGTADDPETIERLKSWLSEKGDAAQGLLWISRDRPLDQPLALAPNPKIQRQILRLFRESR